MFGLFRYASGETNKPRDKRTATGIPLTILRNHTEIEVIKYYEVKPNQRSKIADCIFVSSADSGPATVLN